MENIKDFYNICIKNKYIIRIIKYKIITPMVLKLKKIYTNFSGPIKPAVYFKKKLY